MLPATTPHSTHTFSTTAQVNTLGQLLQTFISEGLHRFWVTTFIYRAVQMLSITHMLPTGHNYTWTFRRSLGSKKKRFLCRDHFYPSVRDLRYATLTQFIYNVRIQITIFLIVKLHTPPCSRMIWYINNNRLHNQILVISITFETRCYNKKYQIIVGITILFIYAVLFFIKRHHWLF